MISDLIEQVKGTTFVQALIIGGLSILGFMGFRRFQRKDAEEAARSSLDVLSHAVANQEGQLSEHLARLERMRADLALTEGRVRKLFTLMDEVRGGRP